MKYQVLCPNASGVFEEIASDLVTNGTSIAFDPSTYVCQAGSSERRLRLRAFIGVREIGGVLEGRDEAASSSYAIRIGGLNDPTDDTPFGSHITTITSTGYYGGSKRQLVAKVDKRNGALLGIFDYALFSGGGSVGTP